jgi:uncharacterized protein involved in type VI secretion and phage assembly
MSESLLDVLRTAEDASPRVTGVVSAVVTNNQDPDKLGRVKVRFPWLADGEESWWARVAAPAAGDQSGVYFLPDVDTEVLVAFEHGDARFPYVLGSLWNQERNPPETNSDGKNALRTIKTPAGHLVRLDDDGNKIEVVAAGGKNSVVIDAGADTIEIKANGDLTVQAGGKLVLKGNQVEISSDADTKLKAAGDANVEASAQLTLKGSLVNIN